MLPRLRQAHQEESVQQQQRLVDGQTDTPLARAKAMTAASRAGQQAHPLARRALEDRDRRHGERAIAAWLRSLARETA
jgi:hypothetical protein